MFKFISDFLARRIQRQQEEQAAIIAAYIEQEELVSAERYGRIHGSVYGQLCAQHNRELPLDIIYNNYYSGSASAAYDEAFNKNIEVGKHKYVIDLANKALLSSS